MNANLLRFLLLNLLFLLIAGNLIGQSITGKVIDRESSQALPFANVILLHAADSTFITGTVTNEEGVFWLEKPEHVGNCMIRFQYVGYETVNIRNLSNDIGTIYLSSKRNTLNEVVVTADAKTFRMENGGISADIQNTSLKEMGALSDVLGQLPLVRKDMDSYTVFGKGAPVFYINNRRVRNNQELQQISSKDVKKVTVITNPGVEYDSSVNAVIKIETIRPVGEGFSADVFTYNRYNKKYSILNNASLNYRKEKLDIFADFSHADMDFPKNRTIIYSIPDNTFSTYITTRSKENDRFRHFIPQVGFNYQVNKSHSMGARYQYYTRPELIGKHHKRIEVVKGDQLEEEFSSDQNYDGNSDSHYVNLYYNIALNKWFTIKLDADYKTTNNEQSSDITNLLETGIREDIITSNTASSDLYAARLIITTPIWSGKLTYGVEFSHTKNRQDSYVIENMGAPGLVPSSNDVKQDLFAGFVSYGKTIGHFSGEVGLRFENITSEYIQNDELVKEQSKDYRNLLPTARITYQNDEFQTELSYRNRVHRPSYDFLRSGIFYMAPYSYFSGNPLLQPTYQNSLTFTAMWRKFIFMTVYNNYKDRFVEGLPQLYLGNSILLKSVSFEKSQKLAFTLSYSSTVGIWRPTIELGMSKDFIEYGVTTYNKPIFNTYFRNNFRLKGWQLGVDIYARTKGHRDADYEERNSWNTNLYINKYFLKGKLGLNINANDVFNTQDDKMSLLADNLKVYYDNSMYRRNIQVRVSYRFNTSPKRYRGTGSTDELERL